MIDIAVVDWRVRENLTGEMFEQRQRKLRESFRKVSKEKDYSCRKSEA